MTITETIKLYFLTVPVFFLIDMLWLGLVAKNFYQKQLGSLLKSNPNWPAAIIFYLVFIAGILIFAVLPSIEKNSIINALIYGGLFGFFTYATYDLTNFSTLNNWPLTVVFVDILWGIVLTSLVSISSYSIAKWLF